MTEINTGVSNLFEFTYTDGEDPAIKRVLYNHPIVAVDIDGKFPSNDEPLVETPSPFRMDHVLGPDNVINIGYVICLDNFSASPTITLCKDENNPILDWKPEYSFTALTAEDVIIDAPNSGSTDKSIRSVTYFGKFKAQSPFRESLNIFIPQIPSGRSMATIRLLNPNGQMIMFYNLDLNTAQISLPAASLLPGIYILQIETDLDVQFLKIVKSE
ncbi:MAG: T9SS type A sorting domain-containing protein [Saprospiraceae bacterium]